MTIAIELTQYAAARTVAALLSPFDPDQNLETARLVGRLYSRCAGKRRERARAGVARAFPTLDLETQRAIVDSSIGHMFGLFMVDAFAMPRTIGHENWQDRIDFEHARKSIKHLIDDKPCIFLTGHIGNWELLGYALALMGFNMTALARPLDNRFLNDWLLGVRQKTGLKVITKWGAVEELERVIDAGGKIGFIADQNAGGDGLFVPFFSRLASTYKSIPLLAMRYQLPIVCGYARRIDGSFRYEVRVDDGDAAVGKAIGQWGSSAHRRQDTVREALERCPIRTIAGVERLRNSRQIEGARLNGRVDRLLEFIEKRRSHPRE